MKQIILVHNTKLIAKRYIEHLLPKQGCCYMLLEKYLIWSKTNKRPVTVIALGAEVLKAIMGQEDLTLGSCRGFTLWPQPHVRMVPTYNPNQLEFKPDVFIDIEEDIYNAVHREPDLRPVEVRTISTVAQLNILYDYMKNLPAKTPIVLDLETSGFNPFKDYMLCLAIALDETHTLIIEPHLSYGVDSSVPRELYQTSSPTDLTGPNILRNILSLDLAWTFHNGAFDIRFLRHHKVLHINQPVVEDTMLLHYLLDERLGTHGLKQLARMKLGVADYDAGLKVYAPTLKSSFANVPQDMLYKYAGLDVGYTMRLLHLMHKDLEEVKREMSPRIYETYAFLIRMENNLADIEDNGVLVDSQALDELDIRLSARIKELDARLQDIVQQELRAKLVLRVFNEKEALLLQRLLEGAKLNTRSPMQISTYLYKLRGLKQPPAWQVKEGSTSIKVLSKLLEEMPDDAFLNTLLDYRRVFKIWSTYVTSIREKIDDDGRIRTKYKIIGTVTGRISGAEPNFMNVPRITKNEYARAIRTMFKAPEGSVFVGADYKSAELRALAEFCKEEFLQQCFREGRDLHSETAAQLYGPNWTKENRIIAKMLVFGLVYGRGSASIANERGITTEEAEVIINNFFVRMPKVGKWLNAMKEEAARKGYLVAPNGRIRRFGLVNNENRWRIDTQATNCTIQAEASDACIEGALRLEEWGRKTGKCKVLMIIHDSIIAECPIEYEAETSFMLRECMVSAARDRLGPDSVPFAVELSSAINWGELSKT